MPEPILKRPSVYRRIPIRTILLVVIAFMLVTSHQSWGQTAGAAPAQPDDKPQGLMHLILSNLDPVFWTIAALSVTGLTLIIQAFIKNRASVFMPEQITEQIREMITQRKFKELMEFTETDDSFLSKSLNPALKRAPNFPAMKEAMETAVGEQTAEQFRKIEYLNIIGNLGPLLGLLGTVLGMITAFSDMQAAHGSADPSKLAGGISQALTHTFLGLFLAIPCLAAFGILRTIVDRLTVRGALTAEEFLLMLKSTEPKPPTAGGAAVTGPRTAATPQPAVRKPAPTPAPLG